MYQIALTLVPGIGDVLGKKLVNLAGDAETIFREPGKILKRLNRSGSSLLQAFQNKELLLRAEAEMQFIEKNRIRPLFFTDPDYPRRLRSCIDSPVMIYYRGNAGLNDIKTVGIVGTRSATEYGRNVCRRLVEGFREQGVIIVSGLAYGIDSYAHRAALDAGLPTLAVLGHGLDRIYPQTNQPLASQIIGQGGLLTDFMSGTRPDRENFPRRNRIIAGLCDALVVVEAAMKGGALITADIANSYNRDVFSIPGRIGDPWSEGTNFLIMSNKAALVQGAEDISQMMGWKKSAAKPSSVQRKIFIEMTSEEELIFRSLEERGKTAIDDLQAACGLNAGKLSAALLNLEFEGIIRCLPGKIYELV